MQQRSHTDSVKAQLSSHGGMTSFRALGENIRFRTPNNLVRYTRVKQWDDGYIVVDALYRNIGEVEEYIDLVPILSNLYIDKDKFLNKIGEVEINYDEAE